MVIVIISNIITMNAANEKMKSALKSIIALLSACFPKTTEGLSKLGQDVAADLNNTEASQQVEQNTQTDQAA